MINCERAKANIGNGFQTFFFCYSPNNKKNDRTCFSFLGCHHYSSMHVRGTKPSLIEFYRPNTVVSSNRKGF